MFKDYYAILGISLNVTDDEIKRVYRELSKKYHPDKNPNQDTTSIMQDINEAYFILSIPYKREIYNKEYRIYQEKISIIQRPNTSYNTYTNYEVRNEELNNIINDARKAAMEYVKQVMKEFKELSLEAGKGAWNEMLPYIIIGAIITLIIMLINT